MTPVRHIPYCVIPKLEPSMLQLKIINITFYGVKLTAVPISVRQRELGLQQGRRVQHRRGLRQALHIQLRGFRDQDP